MKRILLLLCLSTLPCIAIPNFFICIKSGNSADDILQTAYNYHSKLAHPENCTFLIITENNAIKEEIAALTKQPSVLNISVEEPTVKLQEADIILLADQTLVPTTNGFDTVISEQLLEAYPNLDGALLCEIEKTQGVIPCMGKEFFANFAKNNLSSYNSSLFLNQEIASVARMLHRVTTYETPLFSVTQSREKNNSLANDENIFRQRRANNFDYDEETFRNESSKLWSILICTITERQESFERIYNKLQQQIIDNGLENEIEIVYYLDNRGEHSIGEKRNWLLQNSNGYYVNYIDDDDDVHPEYIRMMYECLIKNPDTVNLIGILTINGQEKLTFIHSLKYDKYFRKGRIAYRPPNHLNPIKRHIAVQFIFLDISSGEDSEWCMQIVHSGLLKTEEEIDTPYYFYLYNPHKNRPPRKHLPATKVANNQQSGVSAKLQQKKILRQERMNARKNQ